MTRWTALCRDFARNDSGATAIEYSMIAGCIALLIVASLEQIGGVLAQIFDSLMAGFS